MSSLPEDGSSHLDFSPPEFSPLELSPEDRRALLALARSAIVAGLGHTAPQVPQPEPPCFALRRGVFVTVHVAGKLRGCIGVIEGRETLRDSIVHCAESAAFHDSRFRSVQADELPDLQIEISVLSPLSPIAPEKIEIGTHGLYIVAGHYRGLLLPQVAVEHHLSRERFLEETCHKAGLPPGAWRIKGTELFSFTCQIFHDTP